MHRFLTGRSRHADHRRPTVIAAGHGLPVAGPRVAFDLRRFAEGFTPPRKGRYVEVPARADENGVVEVPPRRLDLLPAKLLAAGFGVGALAVMARRRRSSNLHTNK